MYGPATLYRIHIGGKYGHGDKANESIEDFLGWVTAIANNYLEAATIIPASGVWESVTEPACIVEVITDDPDDLNLLNNFIEVVKHDLKQNAVLVTRQPVESMLA